MTQELLPARTDEEARALVDAESRIERATRRAFYDVGTELRGIREQRLYRAEFGTFDEYCQMRWDWTPQRVGQLIAAANALDEIETLVSILPTRETHVRPLLALPETNTQAEVWSRVVEGAERHGQRITAKLVQAEVDRKLAEKAKGWITLAEWEDMDEDQRGRALTATPSSKPMNKQDNDSIEWARWSWNPITGCRHECEYCYAKDIAGRFMPQGFEPSIIPERLGRPINANPPEKAEVEIGWRNVFTCSMADLFGEWVPESWIHSVLETVERAPQWNFIFLTKNPRRLPGFTFPANAWVGTTVDSQRRVKAAEEAFEHVQATVKFLSVEPMLEALQFDRLDLFDWVILGGASKSARTPEFRPDRRWVAELELSAWFAGCKVYEKPNLLTRVTDYPIG